MKKKLILIFLNYLRLLSKIQLAKIRLLLKFQNKKLNIIGITGSAGKTSTLLAVNAVLKKKFKTKINYGANTNFGIPSNILGFKITDFSIHNWFRVALLAPLKLLTNWQIYEIYVAEMGIDDPVEPENMSYLLKIIRPNIGVFLNVNLTHSQNFDQTVSKNITGSQRTEKILENIGLEKARLINSLPSSGFAIINNNDPIVIKTTRTTLAKILTIKPIKIEIPKYIFPKIYQNSFGAAVSVAGIFGIDQKTTISSLQKNFKLPPSRSSILKGIKNSKIIDSSYNSSPIAAQELLQFLGEFPHPRIAILGDMRELGEETPKAHQNLYNNASKVADLIIGIGSETQKYFPKNNKTFTFQFWWQSINFIKETLNKKEFAKSTILVKGSQNTIFLEELVKKIIPKKILKKYLCQHLICRESPYWLKLKKDFQNQNQ
jgi:UDP-N-acetylmuramoyl-tripeptide--D-alanyl-D-alanine ligase